MEARYAPRTQPWLAACPGAPASFDQVVPRLTTLMAPLVATFCRPALAQHAQTSLCGLRAEVARKKIASIASRCGQDRLPLQRFLGWTPWDEVPWRQAVPRPVAAHVGHAAGVLVGDPAGFPTSGTASGGVARPWGGRLGQGDNGPGAVYWGDVSGAGQTLVARRRYVPKAGTTAQGRLAKAGVPHAPRGYRARHPWAWAMVQTRGTPRAPGWSAGDDERGRPYGGRRRLARLGERSRRAVPGPTVRRDLEAAPAASSGRRRPPTPPGQRVAAWSPALDAGAWQRIDGRAGSQGPLVVDGITRRGGARTPRWQQGDAER
jgi:DDE superfamily endonuclease